MDAVLNLQPQMLRVLDAVEQSRSLSSAAHALGVTQPALSYSLGRLRAHYADPLFVRRGHRLLSTPFLDQLMPEVRDLLARLDRLQHTHHTFQPAQSQRQFRLHMSDVAELIMLPALLKVMAADAPGVSLDIMHSPTARIGDQLVSGEVDLAIGTVPGLSSDHVRQKLCDDEYVCLTAADHPRLKARRTLTRALFADCAHYAIKSVGSAHAQFERQLDRLAPQRRVVLRIPNFTPMPRLIASSEAMCVLPRGLAEAFMLTEPLRIWPLPFDVPPYPIVQAWHVRSHRDAGHQWLRELILRLHGSGVLSTTSRRSRIGTSVKERA